MLLAACSNSNKSSTYDSGSAGGAVADTTASSSASGSSSAGTTASPMMIRGTITSASATELVVQSDSGAVHVQLTQPVQVFDRQPATLASVTPNSFIGVTTVKQPDGSDRATEIHVFPEALRGLGEGSRPMAPSAGSNGTMTNGSTGSTMTNGSTGSTMTNGSASTGQSQSTMSNGSVQGTPGSTMVVNYAGGSKTVTVPPNTPVTQIVAAAKPLSAGEHVVVLVTPGANGAMSSNKILISGK